MFNDVSVLVHFNCQIEIYFKPIIVQSIVNITGMYRFIQIMFLNRMVIEY